MNYASVCSVVSVVFRLSERPLNADALRTLLYRTLIYPPQSRNRSLKLPMNRPAALSLSIRALLLLCAVSTPSAPLRRSRP